MKKIAFLLIIPSILSAMDSNMHSKDDDDEFLKEWKGYVQHMIADPLKEVQDPTQALFNYLELADTAQNQGKDIVATVKQIIQARADINAQEEGMTPLHHAAAMRLTAIINVLLENGARTDIENDDDLTPLAMIEHDLYGQKQYIETQIRINKASSWERSLWNTYQILKKASNK